MNSTSRSASRLAALAGIVGAATFWLLDAASERYLIGNTASFFDILISPGTHEFRLRVLATLLILALALAAALLFRRLENNAAQLHHGHFLLEEATIELGQKNESLEAEIVRRQAIEKQLENLADTDQLTGIFNRRKFDELLNLELRQEARYHRGLCLMMLDIDHFKNVNDRLGHAVGDEVLKELAALIEHTRRDADSFFRIGGEEFGLITFASSGDNLETAAEKIRKTVSEHRFNKVGHLSVSIGATHYQPGDDYYGLFKRADNALYRAKQAGRDRVVIDEPV